MAVRLPRSLTRLLLLVCATTCATLAAPCATAAAPCTLYKARDIANARHNIDRHAWARQIVASWRRQVSYLMTHEQQFVEEMISDLTPWSTYGQSCPVCVNKKSSMGECNLYRWNIRAPDRLVCKYCGTVYPNPKYPETGQLVCPRMEQTFTYYKTAAERAHPEDRSGKYAFLWAG